jgi:hypothetical protein
MPTSTVDRGEDIVAGWRTGAPTLEESANPAGPLFVSGRFAASDLAGDTKLQTLCGTWCTRATCVNSIIVYFCC